MAETDLTIMQTATALRAEERRLLHRLALVRELLETMPKSGPRPKQTEPPKDQIPLETQTNSPAN